MILYGSKIFKKQIDSSANIYRIWDTTRQNNDARPFGTTVAHPNFMSMLKCCATIHVNSEDKFRTVSVNQNRNNWRTWKVLPSKCVLLLLVFLKCYKLLPWTILFWLQVSTRSYIVMTTPCLEALKKIEENLLSLSWNGLSCNLGILMPLWRKKYHIKISYDKNPIVLSVT